MKKAVLPIIFYLTFSLSLTLCGFAQTPSPTPPPVPASGDGDETINIEANLVNILFSASNKNREFVTDLTKNDLEIREDGQPQPIFSFQHEVDLPLSLAILIDASGSQENTLPEEKSAATLFLENVIRPNKDEVAILTFTGATTLEQPLTGNLNGLKQAISRVAFRPPPGYDKGIITPSPGISRQDQIIAASTAIWDAIWITSEKILNEAPGGTRRAIILVTDGINTYGSKKLDDAVNNALKNDAIIYCIGIGDAKYDGVDKKSLRRIAERTGGRAFFPLNETELQNSFKEIQSELRSQYIIAYEPTNLKKDGAFRKVEIRLTNPAVKKQKVNLTYRQGYFAKKNGK